MRLVSIVFFAILVVLSTATTYGTSSVSKTYVKTKSTTLSCAISMDVTTNKLTITMVGPSSVWYGFGFGNSAMSNTYSIIVDGEGNVEERYLIGTTSGNSLDDTFTVDSVSVSGSSRTVVVSRDLDYSLPSTFHYEFAVEDSKLDTVYAYGTTSYLANHGSDKRGSATLSMTRTELTGEKKSFSSIPPINLQNNTSLITILASCIVIFLVILYVIYKYKQTKNDYLPLNSNNNLSLKSIQEFVDVPDVPDENDRLVVV